MSLFQFNGIFLGISLASNVDVIVDSAAPLFFFCRAQAILKHDKLT